MQKCIYTRRETPDATFVSGEHIIPACIGGTVKLDKDWVSSEFNNAISKSELEFARQYPIITLPRMMFGPDGRKNHQGKLGVSFMKSQETSRIQLGYIHNGYPTPISQIIIDTNVFEKNALCKIEGIVTKQEDIESLFNEICRPRNKPLVIQTNDILIEDKIIIGSINNQIYIGVSNCMKYDLANSYLEKIAKLIQEGNIKANDSISTEHIKEHVVYENSIRFSPNSISRVYAKIAFNVLAKIKGQRFVLRNEFDTITNSIVTGTDIEKYVSMPESQVSDSLAKILVLENNEHLIFFQKEKSHLLAVVNLYGNNGSVMIILCDNWTDSFESCGYVCDWQNKKESSLEEYIRHAIGSGRLNHSSLYNSLTRGVYEKTL